MKYPICPECGKNTIVLFTPPKEGIVGTKKGYKLFHSNSPDYIDWTKANLYCCNAESNCETRIPLWGKDTISTPVRENHYQVSLVKLFPENK